MQKEDIAKALDRAHEAMKTFGQAVGGPEGRYQLSGEDGEAVPTFDQLAAAVRAL